MITVAILAGSAAARVHPPILLAVAGVMGVFLMAFLNAEGGLIVLIFSMLLSPELTVGSTSAATLGRGVTLRLDDFLLLIIGLSWFARGAYHKELGLFRKSPLNGPIAAYILACALSTGVGVLADRVSAKTGFFYLLKYFEYFVVYFMIVNYVSDRSQLHRFLFCLLLTAFLASLIGISQIPSGARVSAPFEGASGEPNTFGGYLLLMGAVCGGLLISEQRFTFRLALILLLLVMAIALLYTRSRSSYLGVIPAALTLGVFSQKRPLVLGLILIGLIFSPVILPETVKDRIFYTFTQRDHRDQIVVGGVRLDTSTSARLKSWKQTLSDWTRHPILGYGITGYAFIDAQFPRVLVETGLLGLTAFVYLLYSVFRIARNALQEVTSPFAVGIIRGFIAGYVGLIFHAIGANTFIIVRIMEPFWFLVGIVALLPATEGTEGK